MDTCCVPCKLYFMHVVNDHFHWYVCALMLSLGETAASTQYGSCLLGTFRGKLQLSLCQIDVNAPHILGVFFDSGVFAGKSSE